MSLELSCTVQEGFLDITLRADAQFETSRRLWTEIFALCEEHGIRKILVVSDSEPLETLAAYEHHRLLKGIGFTPRYQVARVEKNPATFAIDEFIENVLTNRGVINAKLFPDKAAAQAWLVPDVDSRSDDAQ